ncbi:MAG: hypothetical protein Kow0010_17760 [Dehalococcoidia bacterium]
MDPQPAPVTVWGTPSRFVNVTVVPGPTRAAAGANTQPSFRVGGVALADFRRCALWTDDRSLIQAVGVDGPEVRWIGDYEPA